MDNSKRIILDLCGGTGSWSAPYKQAGYDVRLITLPEYDVLTYDPPKNVFGVLAAPPCTDFSVMGSSYWKIKDNNGCTAHSLNVVNACLKIIKEANPLFWCLENPKGRLRYFIGNPYCRLNYMQFGCTYSKPILLWGKFVIPMGKFYNTKSVGDFQNLLTGDLSKLPDGYSVEGTGMSLRSARRSITYSGFAEAFYLQNSALNSVYLEREQLQKTNQWEQPVKLPYCEL